MTTLRLQSRATDARERYQFRTRDGIHSDDSFREGELLALDHCWDVDLGDLLVVQASYGVVGIVLAERSDSVTMTEATARAAECCRENARTNGVRADVRTVPTPDRLERQFDTAVYVPKPYTPLAVGKQRLADALCRLRTGGQLFLAGTGDSGLTRYRRCLESLDAQPRSVGGNGRLELVRATRPPDLDTPSFVEPRVRETTISGRELRLVTAPGLFASGGLDDGTRLLLESVDVADGDRVLDLCCGYGPVGTCAALDADCSVVLTDDDARATEYAKRTLAANGVEGEVVTADCLDGVSGRTFDGILSNPPTHAGSGVLRDLFDGAADVLAPGGRVTFVHHRSLDLAASLTAFETVERVATGPDHFVQVAQT